MSIHIHLYGCNCIFCSSDFPLDFFQSQNGDAMTSQSATTPNDDDDSSDEDSELEDDWDDDDEEDDDEEDDEDDGDEPKSDLPKKKKLFGFLIGDHDVCVL